MNAFWKVETNVCFEELRVSLRKHFKWKRNISGQNEFSSRSSHVLQSVGASRLQK